MEIYFLGTSAGTPTKNRNVTAAAIIESTGGDWYLVDCGEGTQHQILKSNLSLPSLRAIFITHVHGDHCYGLPGLLASAGLNGRRAPLTIVAPNSIKIWFEATQNQTQLFLPYDLNFIPSESLPEIEFGQFSISVIALSHRVPSYAYSFKEAKSAARLNTAKLKTLGIPQGPLWGKIQTEINFIFGGKTFNSSNFLISENKFRKIIICGDNDKPELLRDACLECDVLVHEATYTENVALKVGDIGHSYAKQIASFAEQCNIPNLILTHFSSRYQFGTNSTNSIDEIRDEASQVFSRQLYLAEDFQKYRLNKVGILELVTNE